MKKAFILFAIAVAFVACAVTSFAQTVEVTVNPNKVIGKIDPKIYGHFLEHIYNSCNGGLWGELVWNRSFELYSGAVFQVQNGTLIQDEIVGNPRTLVGNADMTDYEMTFDAKKTAGEERFLILYKVR